MSKHNPEPIFTVGQQVVATGPYMWSLTEGKTYTVVEYTPELPTPTFTFPAYVTVVGDLGNHVTGHTHRFACIQGHSA